MGALRNRRVAVIGAGAFGGWTALHLVRQGFRVTLVDAWGPGNSRASSGGETRIIRSLYGDDQLSVRFAIRSLQLWQEHEQRWNTRLFQRTGMLLLAPANDDFVSITSRVLNEHQVPLEHWSKAEAARRHPQIDFDGIDSVLFEPRAGVLTARENCRAVLKHFIEEGGQFHLASVPAQHITADLRTLPLSNGVQVQADQYVFACGPWLPQIFPDVLGNVIRPSRQDVLFVGTPPGDDRFSVQSLPCWADRTSADKFYGIPDVQHRGFKIASDLRGPTFDPDTEDRIIDAKSWTKAQAYLSHRFPALAGSPLLEARVCQYENTPDLALLIDRHPSACNVLLVGGGSGHGYKHGPAVGEHVAGLVAGQTQLLPALSLARFALFAPQRQSSF